MKHEVAVSDLLSVIDRLLAEDGCPWDKEQTVVSLSHMLLEEVCETIDAIGDRNQENLADELGDLFVAAFFFAKAAGREGRFSWLLPFEKAKEKLIRRHPHIFENAQQLSSDDVIKQWDEIKKKEKSHHHRTKAFDGIPSSLPGLAQMQKLFSKVKKHRSLVAAAHNFCTLQKEEKDEESIGKRLAAIVLEAETKGIQAEQALRKVFNLCKNELENHQ